MSFHSKSAGSVSLYKQYYMGFSGLPSFIFLIPGMELLKNSTIFGVYSSFIAFASKYEQNYFIFFVFFFVKLTNNLLKCPGIFITYSAAFQTAFVLVILLHVQNQQSPYSFLHLAEINSLSFFSKVFEGPGLLHGISFLVLYFFITYYLLVLQKKTNYLSTPCSVFQQYILQLFSLFVFFSGAFWAFFSSVWGNWYNNDPIEIFYLFIVFYCIATSHNTKQIKFFFFFIFCYIAPVFLVFLRFGFLNSKHTNTDLVLFAGGLYRFLFTVCCSLVISYLTYLVRVTFFNTTKSRNKSLLSIQATFNKKAKTAVVFLFFLLLAYYTHIIGFVYMLVFTNKITHNLNKLLVYQLSLFIFFTFSIFMTFLKKTLTTFYQRATHLLLFFLSFRFFLYPWTLFEMNYSCFTPLPQIKPLSNTDCYYSIFVLEIKAYQFNSFYLEFSKHLQCTRSARQQANSDNSYFLQNNGLYSTNSSNFLASATGLQRFDYSFSILQHQIFGFEFSLKLLKYLNNVSSDTCFFYQLDFIFMFFGLVSLIIVVVWIFV